MPRCLLRFTHTCLMKMLQHWRNPQYSLINGPQIPIGSGVKKHILEDAMLNPEAALSIH